MEEEIYKSGKFLSSDSEQKGEKYSHPAAPKG